MNKTLDYFKDEYVAKYGDEKFFFTSHTAVSGYDSDTNAEIPSESSEGWNESGWDSNGYDSDTNMDCQRMRKEWMEKMKVEQD